MRNPKQWSVSNPPFDSERLFSLLDSQSIDLLIVSSRHNTRYLTGGYFYPLFVWDSHTRRTQHLSFLAVQRGSLESSFFVGRPNERAVMSEAEVWVDPVIEAPAIGIIRSVETLVDELRKRRLDRARIGLELASIPAAAYLALQKALPHAEFVDALPVLDPLRAVKLPDELDIIRDGSRRNVDAVTDALAAGRDGESTAAVAERVEREFRERGLHYLYSLVCAGPHFFRAPSEKRIWQRGRPLHIDAGGLIDGYCVEVCRMGSLGSPSPAADELLAACRDLRDHVLGILEPGAPAKDVQRSANEYLETTPHGEIGKFIGHGIGLVHHEDPRISLTSQDVLESGMVISIEMEYRHEDVGHIKVEELVVITDAGNEVISPSGEKWTIAGV
mgnify:CR=1 FL=1